MHVSKAFHVFAFQQDDLSHQSCMRAEIYVCHLFAANTFVVHCDKYYSYTRLLAELFLQTTYLYISKNKIKLRRSTTDLLLSRSLRLMSKWTLVEWRLSYRCTNSTSSHWRLLTEITDVDIGYISIGETNTFCVQPLLAGVAGPNISYFVFQGLRQRDLPLYHYISIRWGGVAYTTCRPWATETIHVCTRCSKIRIGDCCRGSIIGRQLALLQWRWGMKLHRRCRGMWWSWSWSVLQQVS